MKEQTPNFLVRSTSEKSLTWKYEDIYSVCVCVYIYFLPGHLSWLMRSRKDVKLKNKKSSSTSLAALFFLVAAKGLNNDRYNEKKVWWLVKRRAYRIYQRPPYSLHGVKRVVHNIRNRAIIQDAAWLASLSLGGSGNGRGLHRHSSRGGLMMSISSDLQPPCPSRHQADRVAGEKWQVLRVQEERRGHQVGRVTSRRVSKQQVTAIQRGDGDCAARCQSCGEDKEEECICWLQISLRVWRTKPALWVKYKKKKKKSQVRNNFTKINT